MEDLHIHSVIYLLYAASTPITHKTNIKIKIDRKMLSGKLQWDEKKICAYKKYKSVPADICIKQSHPNNMNKCRCHYNNEYPLMLKATCALHLF